MFRHKFVRATVWLTTLGIILAIGSLLLPWYKVTDGYRTSNDYVRYSTVEFNFDYFVDSGAMEDYDREYEGVGSLMRWMAFLIGLWALLAMMYMVIIIPDHNEYPILPEFQGERYDGVMLGWIIMALSLLPVLSFAVGIADSCECGISTFVGSNTLDKWGPMSGWFIAVLACAVQWAAVLLRNLPALANISKDSGKVPSDDLPHGDLPIR